MNLDELKKKLFAALPPAVREKLGIELDEEEHDEDEDIDVDSEEATANHDVEEIDDQEDDESEEEDDEEAEKKAKRSKIIRGIVILAIAYFALDEFLAEPEVETVPDVKIVRPKRPPRPKKTPTTEPEVVATATAEAAPEVASEVAGEPPAATPEVEATPEIEVPPETPSEVLVETTPTPVPEATEETFEMSDWSGMGQVEATPTSAPTAEVPNDTSDSGFDAIMEAVDKSSEITTGEVDKVKLDRSDPSYIPPPNYLRSGRGLVYNCREKHWACVDKFSYFTCFENQKWNEKNSRPSECVTRDVYASVGDCTAIQKFYVNKPEPTDFCGEQKDADSSSSGEAEDLSNLLAP